tara:strand:+ start:71 stop:664 length:594 start_codon:yes stop_codon:yes gene_type:complete
MKKIISFLGQRFVYEGNIKNNKPEGYGSLKNTQGIIYEGNFKNGKLNGEGIYSGPQTLKNIIYKFSYFFGSFPTEYRVVGQFKDNKLHGNGIKIFTSNGDFFLGFFKNGNLDKGLFSGWIVEDEGGNILLLYWSKETESYEYKACEKGSFYPKYNTFVDEYEKQFQKFGWFPKQICKNKVEFEEKLLGWKKHKKKLV